MQMLVERDICVDRFKTIFIRPGYGVDVGIRGDNE